MKKVEIEISKEELEELLNKGYSRDDLVKYFNVSLSTIKRRLSKFSLSAFHRVFDEKKFDELYDKGLTDAEIARQLGVSCGTISNYRKKINKPSNFSYNRDKIRNAVLNLKTLNEEEISKQLNLDKRIVNYFKTFDETCFNKWICSDQEFQVILGSILGDGCIHLNRSGNLGHMRFAHSEAQKEYCIWKGELLKNIIYYERLFERKERFDNRTNKTYVSYWGITKESLFFKDMFCRWYDQKEINEQIRNIKHICREDFLKIEPLGLAIWFQDDGYRIKTGYYISTMCFEKDDLEFVKQVFKEKWDIEITICKNNEIYIPAKFRDKFTNLIRPYIHDVCKYKLIEEGSCKTPLNGEPPEKDNPVLNSLEIEKMPND